MGSKTSVSYQGVVELEEVKSVLRGLLESLDENRVVVRRGAEHITLSPASVVELELTGKQKKDRQSLEIELSWRLEAPVEAAAGVSISSVEPEPEPEPEPAVVETAPQLAEAAAEAASLEAEAAP